MNSDTRLAIELNSSSVVILDELLNVAPDHIEGRLVRLNAAIDWLRFCVHEWPAGIPYGMDGATLAECGEIRSEVAVAGQIDVDKCSADFLDGFEEKLSAYEEQLRCASKLLASPMLHRFHR